LLQYGGNVLPWTNNGDKVSLAKLQRSLAQQRASSGRLAEGTHTREEEKRRWNKADDAVTAPPRATEKKHLFP
jgi:hypothetical protein